MMIYIANEQKYIEVKMQPIKFLEQMLKEAGYCKFIMREIFNKELNITKENKILRNKQMSYF